MIQALITVLSEVVEAAAGSLTSQVGGLAARGALAASKIGKRSLVRRAARQMSKIPGGKIPVPHVGDTVHHGPSPTLYRGGDKTKVIPPRNFQPSPPVPPPTVPPPLPSPPVPPPVQPPPLPRIEPKIEPKIEPSIDGGKGLPPAQPRPQSSASQPVPMLPFSNGLATTDALNNLTSRAQNLAGSYLPRISWTGEVSATGFATTPTRTVLHYCLAVAFGLMRQTRIGSIALSVRIEYRTNTVHVSYVSQTSMLTEVLSVAMLTGMGRFASVEDLLKLASAAAQISTVAPRSILGGFASFNPTNGVAEITKNVAGAVDAANNALSAALNIYQNVGRDLGPLAVWDMPVANQFDRMKGNPQDPQFSDETIYGGLPSMFLTPPPNVANPENRLPSPFSLMVQQPMLTRNPAPNPQPPAPVQAGARPWDSASGYSVDLRSLVSQALYDPGVNPPRPDTNVSLTPVYEM